MAPAANRRTQPTTASLPVRRNDAAVTWAPLLQDGNTASPLLWRLTDSLYFYLKSSHAQEHDFVGIHAGHFRYLLKIVALEDDAKIEARARNFKTYLNSIGVDYQIVHRDGKQHATLTRRGWLNLLAWEVRVVPVYSYKWWKRLLKHLPLVDPQTNLPFPSHPPRVVFPARGDAQLLPIAYNFVGLLKSSMKSSDDLRDARQPHPRERRDIPLADTSASAAQPTGPSTGHRVLRRPGRPRPDTVVEPSIPVFPERPPPQGTRRASGSAGPSPISSQDHSSSSSRSPHREPPTIQSTSLEAPVQPRSRHERMASEPATSRTLSHSLSQPALTMPRVRESLRLEIPPYPAVQAQATVGLTVSNPTPIPAADARAAAVRPYATVGRTARRATTMYELDSLEAALGSAGHRSTIIMPDDHRLAYNPFVQLLAGLRSLEDPVSPPVPPTLREGHGNTNPFKHLLRQSRVEATM